MASKYYTTFTYLFHNRTEIFKTLKYYITFTYVAPYMVSIAPQFAVLLLVLGESLCFFFVLRVRIFIEWTKTP